MFTILTGAQFGDEGKGKIVDLMAENYDLVVRFQGGDNAGHTVKVADQVYKLHLIPSAFLLDSRVLIGPGTVLNPKVLLEEIDMLKKGGIEITPQKLGIDGKTSIIMPHHIELDTLRESAVSEKIGTTKRGIGFAYIDKISREEIQLFDIANEETFYSKLEDIREQKQKMLESYDNQDSKAFDVSVLDEYLAAGKVLSSYITDVSSEINDAIKKGKNVMAEGAQGSHLDVVHGTQKYVTSSSTIAGSACSNLGVGPTKVDEVIGIVKAYITRVGEGPLPTELHDDIGRKIQEQGGEFGTTTGRARRCGWFDLPLAKKAINLNGYSSLALTKLDVLTNIDPIKICVGYSFQGETYEYPPAKTSQLFECAPIYKELSGWDENLSNVNKYGDLPESAKKYVDLLENMMDVPIKYISVGPGREQTFRKL